MKKRVCCLLVAIVMLLGVCFVGCKKKEPEKPAFVPPAFDAGAVVGEPTLSEGEKGYMEFYPNAAYRFRVCCEVWTADGKADVWFSNSAENTVWLKLRVHHKQTGEILGETGLVKPGEYVQTLTFLKTPAAGTEIVLRVMSYEPETYYSRGEFSINTVSA